MFSPVGYSVVTNGDWAAAYRFANRLLRSGARVLVAVETTSIERGSFIVPLSCAFDPWLGGGITADDVQRAATDAGVSLSPLSETDRVVAAPLAVTRVGLYGGGGAPFNHAAILALAGFPVQFLSDADVRAGRLGEVDVFVMPGGGFRAMHGQIEPLGEDGCRAIAEWVRRGGMYIGCCAGSYDCIVNTDSFLRSCPAQGHLQLINAGPWADAAAVEFLDLQSPGVGVVKVRNGQPDHPVMFAMPEEFEIVHYNGPVLDPLPERVVRDASEAVGLATFSGWTDRFTPAEGFAGGQTDGESTYLARAVAAKRCSIMAGEFGLGRVVAFGSHPEFGFDLAMTERCAPARMLANAVLWQSMSGGAGAKADPAPNVGKRIGLPIGSTFTAVVPLAHKLAKLACDLRAKSIDPPPGWLNPEYAMSVFGLPPREVWCRSLVQLADLANDVAGKAEMLRNQFAENVSAYPDGFPVALLDALLKCEQWMLDERPAEWQQDGGYQGVLALLRTAIGMCEKALANWHVELGPPDGPYGYVHDNPYHLVAGSYLAAIGCAAGAGKLMEAMEGELAVAEWVASSASAKGR